MMLDLQSMFSGSVGASGTKFGQGITATAISDNVIDRTGGLTAPTPEDEGVLGIGQQWLIVQAQTAAAGGDAAKTLTITLESDSAASLAVAPVVHFGSAAILGSAITAGAVLLRAMLPSADYKRYLGLRYTVSAGFTSFNILAYLTPNPQRAIVYAGNFSLDV